MGQTYQDVHKKLMAKSVRRVKNYIFAMTNLFLVSWMMSIIALGYTKYDAKHGSLWEPSFAIGIIFVCLMVLSAISLKRVSDNVLRYS